jgi:2-C-methyl-D-erythritol 2,4-cyclodiphosphate synthase
MSFRVGIGYDIHRLQAGRGLMIAGVQVACPYQVVAHSDGDVVLHALCDALLGACAAGDLGELFPDSDQAHAGRDSSEFLAEILSLSALAPWRIANVDINVIAQAPRLGEHKAAMRIRLARLLGIALDRVGLKARTNEECDAIGAKQAIAAQVVVLLEQRHAQRPTAALARRRRAGLGAGAGAGTGAPGGDAEAGTTRLGHAGHGRGRGRPRGGQAP